MSFVVIICVLVWFVVFCVLAFAPPPPRVCAVIVCLCVRCLSFFVWCCVFVCLWVAVFVCGFVMSVL